MAPLSRAVLAWSGGKDSAFALHVVRQAGEIAIEALLTTVDESTGRGAVHDLPGELLAAQAEAAGLPCLTVPLPRPCPNETYEARMAAALAPLREGGVTRVVFGDLFLADIRAWREAQMAAIGLEAVFPLWDRPTDALAREMIASGLAARLVAVDTARLDMAFAGRAFDAGLLADLPPGVDPCGENGEFHTAVTAGPMFRNALRVAAGPVVLDGATARVALRLS
jgi:uncharacterized protein (TIGR00290 family)